MNPPGTPIAYTMTAAPLSKRSKRKHATVQVTYFMGGNDIPTQEQARDIAWSYRALKDGALWDVLQERVRQVIEKGWDAEHDDGHTDGALAAVAARVAHPHHDAPSPAWADHITNKWAGDRRQQIVIAAALLVAEIERLDRVPVAQEKA